MDLQHLILCINSSFNNIHCTHAVRMQIFLKKKEENENNSVKKHMKRWIKAQ